MDDIDRRRAVTFLRILGWMFGAGMLINAAMSSIAHGPAHTPGYLFVGFGSVALLEMLAWTSPTVKRWLS